MAGDITQLLVAHREGRPEALEQLMPLVYADLRRMFASASGTGGVLHRVHPAGGTADVLTSLDPDRGDRAHAFPHVLPRGDGVLFTILTQGTPLLAALRFESRDVRVLTEGSQPH